MRFPKKIGLVCLFLASLTACRDVVEPVSLIPVARQVQPDRGAFDLRRGVSVARPDSVLMPVADYLREVFSAHQIESKWVESGANCRLWVDALLPREGYRLEIGKRSIDLCGGSAEGVAWGVSTLRQLLWSSSERLPAMTITDAPRFAWRGVSLDVATHFFTPTELRQLIDQLSLYKLNRLHLRLSNDEAWRVEIRRYPMLTEKGGWRRLNRADSLCLQRAEQERDPKYELPADRLRRESDGTYYGGFYTQSQLRDLVAYAAQRGVEILPEVDLTTHTAAAIAAVEELQCADCKGNAARMLCPGCDSSLSFCEEVLAELCELFPSRYLHIGGDPLDPSAWAVCEESRRRIVREKLGGVNALEPWFLGRLEVFCAEKGKTLVGRDGVIGCGLSQQSVVIWGENQPPMTLSQALQQQLRVVLSPSEYLTLDGMQDRNSLAKICGWEPFPESFVSSADWVQGVEAVVPTPQIPTLDALGEALFPRLLALSQLAWSTPENRAATDFNRCLPRHIRQTEAMGWNYRLPDVTGLCDRNVFVDSARVVLGVPDGATLRYTLDGSLPDQNAPLYEGPFTIRTDCSLALRCYNRRGVASSPRFVTFRRAEFVACSTDRSLRREGVLVRWYDFRGACCDSIDRAPLLANFVRRRIEIPDQVSGSKGLVFDGYIDLPTDGIYSFYTDSDDGSMLRIDDRIVVDNDGRHPCTERSGQIALRRGSHKFSVRYFDADGGVLRVGMIDSLGVRRAIPLQMLGH